MEQADILRSSSMAKRQPPQIRLISASERRATKQYVKKSGYNTMNNFNQLPSVMQATADRITRRLLILADAGLNPNTCNCLICDATIEAAERETGCYVNAKTPQPTKVQANVTSATIIAST
jgi:hypothetical protein